MLVRLRREYAQLVTSGAQLLLLLVGFKLESRSGWLLCFSAIAAISIPAWLSALSRLRAIRDTPTSRIGSAAQGYVELTGRGEIVREAPLLSKFTALPCLWYRYTVERKNSNDSWEVIDRGESLDCFLLRDDTGSCLVDPEQAEIITKHRDQWQKDGYQYTEWKFIDHDFLYVIGHFRTQGASNVQLDRRAELNALLTEWKKDSPRLLARFDLDENGELDMNEWMLARSAAKREVNKMMRESVSHADFHVVGRPQDGKLFLISNVTPAKLSRRYLLWAWAHLIFFFSALGGIGWLMQSAPS